MYTSAKLGLKPQYAGVVVFTSVRWCEAAAASTLLQISEIVKWNFCSHKLLKYIIFGIIGGLLHLV